MAEKYLPQQNDLIFSGKPQKVRKPYRKPLLEDLGDLRSLTLGGSPGAGDSGGGVGVELPPGVHAGSLPYGYPVIINPDGSIQDSSDPLNTP